MSGRAELLPDGFVAVGRPPRPGPGASGALRTAAATVLVVLTGLLTAAGLTATWVRGELLDTARYVAVVGPLGSDPAVRADVARLVSDAVTPRLAGVPAQARPAVTRAVRDAATAYTASPDFAALWTGLHRTGHAAVVATVRGDPLPRGASVKDGTLRLDLTPAVDAVRADVTRQAAAAGLRVSVPRVTLAVQVADVATLAGLRPWADRLDLSASVAPWAALVCALLAVAVARDRLLALAAAGLAVAAGAGAVLLLASVAVGRATARLEAAGATAAVGPAVVDRLVGPLDSSAVVVGGVGLAVAAAAAGIRLLARRRT